MRFISIPLLGIIIPYVSGIIDYDAYSFIQLLFVHLYFVCTSLLIWSGCSWVHKKLRPTAARFSNPVKGIAIVLAASGLYGICIAGLMAALWYRISSEVFHLGNTLIFISCSVLAVIIFALMYEIIYLGIERKKDSSLVEQMDRDLTQAELLALTQETDHHFIFNSLNAMHHLIAEDPAQARAFNENLTEVYKYFLLNKKKHLISLPEEMEFMQRYFFLLRIRFGDKIRLCNRIQEAFDHFMIPPCSLQILVENAIKHNEFSASQPLLIMLEKSGNYIKVSNSLQPKSYPAHSTNIGLKNLNLRFRLTCKEDIVIENADSLYSVKLPLIKKVNQKV